MKWTTALLSVLPLAMATADLEAIDKRAKALIVPGAGKEIIIIWANPGAGAATTTINKQVTVTQTVTVGSQPTNIAGTNLNPGQTATLVQPPGASHTVKVGGPGGLVFQPQQLNVPVGDTVIFEFLSQNHTVTQSGFKEPCKKIDNGMDTGFVPNPNNTVSPAPQVAMQVTVNTPLCKSFLVHVLRV